MYHEVNIPGRESGKNRLTNKLPDRLGSMTGIDLSDKHGYLKNVIWKCQFVSMNNVFPRCQATVKQAGGPTIAGVI